MTTEWPIGHGVWDTGLRGYVRLVPVFLSGRVSDPEIFARWVGAFCYGTKVGITSHGQRFTDALKIISIMKANPTTKFPPGEPNRR